MFVQFKQWVSNRGVPNLSGDDKVERTQKKFESFSVQTDNGPVKNVPMIHWKELVPYWKNICKAFLEVLSENDFKPYTATFKRPKGFVASSQYWRLSMRNPARFPLSDARFFIAKLQEKECFTNSINEFNQKIQKSWLEEKNIAVLGGYLYSFYYTLKPVLKVVGEGSKASIKPMIAPDS